MARRHTNLFGLAFLDAITCGFGAVVLVFMIINASVGQRSGRLTGELQGEVDRLEIGGGSVPDRRLRPAASAQNEAEDPEPPGDHRRCFHHLSHPLEHPVSEPLDSHRADVDRRLAVEDPLGVGARGGLVPKGALGQSVVGLEHGWGLLDGR